MPNDAVSILIPIHNVAENVVGKTRAWSHFLKSCQRDWEIILVDDASTDGTAEVLEPLIGPTVRLLRHEMTQGVGACIRTALAQAKHPLVCITLFDYPYTPADLGPMLERIDVFEESIGRKFDIVAGCRNGLPSPGFWKVVGKIYRGFCRIAFGLPLSPPIGWLGVSEHVRSWYAWLIFGCPLTDPNSGFKLFRKELIERFPIQSNGGFVHAELIAKSTFLVCLMDELPLTAKNVAIPHVEWSEAMHLFSYPEFNHPERAESVSDGPSESVADAFGS